MPRFRDGFDGPDGSPPDPGRWQVDGGDWRHRDGELVQHDPGARPATALLAGGQHYEEYLFEANARLVETGHELARYGIFLKHGPGDRTSLTLAADGSGMLCERERDTQETNQRTSPRLLWPGFKSEAYHRLLVSARGGEVEVRVDGGRVTSGIEVPPATSSVGLITWGASAAFDGVSVTSLAGRPPNGRPPANIH